MEELLSTEWRPIGLNDATKSIPIQYSALEADDSKQSLSTPIMT